MKNKMPGNRYDVEQGRVGKWEGQPREKEKHRDSKRRREKQERRIEEEQETEVGLSSYNPGRATSSGR